MIEEVLCRCEEAPDYPDDIKIAPQVFFYTWHSIQNLCCRFQLLNVRLVRERIFGHGEAPGTNLETADTDRKLGGAVVSSFGATGNVLGAAGGRLRGAVGKTTKFGQGESRACGTRCRNLSWKKKMLAFLLRKMRVYPKKARNMEGRFLFIVNSGDHRQARILMSISWWSSPP